MRRPFITLAIPHCWKTLLIALVTVCAGGSAGQWLLHSANDPTEEILAILHAHADGTSEPTIRPLRRLVIVLLDGLGETYLERLVQQGELGPVQWHARVDVGTPSLSRPVYHVLLTGVPQSVSGVNNNTHVGPARADCITHRVRAAGGRVAWALETVPWFHDLCGRPEDGFVHGPAVRDPEVFAQLFRRGATLTVLHLVTPDVAGHAHGAQSREYHTAALEAVRTVRTLQARIAREPDGMNTVWFIGADHGHLPRGGHGGPEASVTRTAWFAQWPSTVNNTYSHTMQIPGPVPATRMAATFAAALGVAPPREALGIALPLPEGITLENAATARIARRAAAVEHTLRKHRALVGRTMLLRASGFALVCIAWSAFLVRRGQGRTLAGGWIVLVGAWAGFAVLGPGWTLSAIRTHAAFLTHAIGAIAAGAAPSWLVAQRIGTRIAFTLMTSTLPAAFAMVVTGGSLGRSAVGPVGALLWPTTGLIPAGVALGILAGETIRRRFAR